VRGGQIEDPIENKCSDGKLHNTPFYWQRDTYSLSDPCFRRFNSILQRGIKMPVLEQPNNKLTVIAKNTALASNWGTSRKGRTSTAPSSDTLPLIRMDKVLAIRQQLAEGKYDLEKRLDAILDRLFKALTA
jgi:hypothetical protein